MLGEVDSLTHFQIPKPTERQRIRDEIKAAFIFARADFVRVSYVSDNRGCFLLGATQLVFRNFVRPFP